MSAKKAKSRKISKLMVAFLSVAFLAIVGGVALFAIGTIFIAKSRVPSSSDGIPINWKVYEETSNVESKITAKNIDDKYIQYVASLKNDSDSNELTISQLSSYIAGNKYHGFISLSEDNLEYTYEPDRANSWTPISISEPGILDENFEFDYHIHIGRAGTKTDTVYFRFNVDVSDDGLVDNVISYVITDESGLKNIITDSASIDTDDGSGQSSTKSSDEITSWATISTVNFDETSRESLSTDVIVIVAAIGVFAVGLAIYLICRR